jgi:hypothetical protein
MNFNISQLNCTAYNMQPSYRRIVSCNYFAISVYKKGYLRNVFSHQKSTKRYEYGYTNKYYFQMFSSIIPQAYNANNGHSSITTWQKYAQTSCARPHPTTSHHLKPGYLHPTFRTKQLFSFDELK